MRTLLADKDLPQSCWRNILPSVIFSLNSTESLSTKCIPFEVIYGRYPTLPYDIVFGTVQRNISDNSAIEYLRDVKVQMFETMNKVAKELNISRARMQRHYNKKIHFFLYESGKYGLKRKPINRVKIGSYLREK